MELKIKIGDKEMTARASALVPRLYRYHFNRDIIQDMKSLENSLKATKKKEREFSIGDLTMFENVAWLFFKLGGEDVKDNPDEWLDSIDGMFSIYEVLPQLMKLWDMNTKTLAKPKKK